MKLWRKNIPQPKWMMSIVYLILLLLVTGVLMGLRNCSPSGVLVEPAREGESAGDTLDIGLLYAPLNYYMYDDTLGGYSYDLLRIISANENQPVTFIPVTSVADALRRLRKGQIDVIASLPVSSAKDDDILFTDSVFTDRLVLIYNKTVFKDTITSPFVLAGKKVHMDSGNAAILRLHHLQDEIGDTIFTERHPDLSDELIAMKVAGGDFEFGVINSRVAEEISQKFPVIRTMPIGFTQLQSWAVADSAMLTRINILLRKSAESSATQALRKRYNL